MLGSAHCRNCIVKELLVDFRETAGLCACTSASSDEDVDLMRIHLLLREHLQDDITAERKLIIYMREPEKLRSVMEQISLEQLLLIEKEADFR